MSSSSSSYKTITTQSKSKTTTQQSKTTATQQSKTTTQPRKIQQQTGATSFCRVCMNAGKSESEYRSHFTKNDSGIVLCPTILNATCSYCKAKGHFKGECPILKTKELKSLKIIIPQEQEQEQEQPQQQQQQQQQQQPQISRVSLSSTHCASNANANTKKSYMQIIMQEMFDNSDDESDDENENVNVNSDINNPPFLFRKRRDIRHDWNDEEYWSDSNEEFN
jgi:hypothetical protein